MAHTGTNVRSHDVAAIVDIGGHAKGSAGEIDRGETAPAQQKAMGYASTHVKSYDVAAGVDPPGLGGYSAREINRGDGGVLCKNVRCSAQRETECEQVKSVWSSHMCLHSI